MNKKMIQTTLDNMESNIRFMLDNIVTKEDLNDLNWYNVAHVDCEAESRRLGVDYSTFVAMVAVMSPFQTWETNIQSATDIIETGKTVYGYIANRTKALQILAGDMTRLRGVKVTRFYANIMEPEKSDIVTLDQWMFRIFLNNHSTIDVPVNDKQYEPIQTRFIQIAESLGYHPVKLQAVLWVAVRRYVKEEKVDFNSPLFTK